MKYDNNQYYYSPSQNYPWYLSDNKPYDAIPMTIAMEEKYEAGIKQGLVMQPAKNGFVMVHPDTLLTEQERIERDKQLLVSQANALLDQSIKLESSVYQRKMSTDQISEFEAWQDDLLEFIDGNSEIMPITPEFIQVLL